MYSGFFTQILEISNWNELMPLSTVSCYSPQNQNQWHQLKRQGQARTDILGTGWFRCLTGTGSLCPSPPTHPCTRLYKVCVFQLLSRDTGICSCNCTSWLMWPEGTTESLAAAALHLWSLVWGHKLQCVSVAVPISCKQGHLIIQPQQHQGRRPLSE